MTSRFLVVLTLLGCAPRSAEPETTATQVEEEASSSPKVEATESQGALYRALSPRDGAPPCAEVEALSPTPVDDLVWLTEHATSPPWVGTRAATCLIAGHSDEVADLLRTWVTDPASFGFGLLVLGNLDLLSSDLAVELAGLALSDGPDPEAAMERIATSSHPEVRALLPGG